MSKNTAFRVHNESPQSERRAILRNERAAGTYHQFAVAEAGVARGRFTAHEKSTVIGSEPVKYPALPASSPWASDPLPAEEPLGFDVNAVEPCGTYEEIQKSLREARSDDVGDSFLQVADSASPGDAEALRGGSASTHASRPRRRSSKRSKG